MKTILLLLAVMFFSQNCSKPELEQSKEQEMGNKIVDKFPVEIGSVYFESWVSGVRGGGAGTNFYIEFKTRLPKEIVLKQLYFRDKQSALDPSSETLYLSKFINNEINPRDDVLMNYETSTSRTIAGISPFPIKDNQAILEYVIKDELFHYLISDVKERELEFYPD